MHNFGPPRHSVLMLAGGTHKNDDESPPCLLGLIRICGVQRSHILQPTIMKTACCYLLPSTQYRMHDHPNLAAEAIAKAHMERYVTKIHRGRNIGSSI